MENKNMKLGTSIAKTASAENTQETKKDFGDTLRTNKHVAKVKLTVQKVFNKDKLKKMKIAFFAWLKKLPHRLSKAITRALITGIILNVIANYFWPELPEVIPTIYGFFNGFVTLGEFIYKVALGGIASLFNGTFFEFGAAMMAELGEMLSAFWTWISSIGF